MKAALAGRQDKRLVIVGRTSAMAMTGVEDTIARLKAYEAGRRRHAVHDRREDARAARRRRRGRQAAAVSRQPGRRALRSRLSQRPQRARLPAGPPAVHGRGQCGARNPQGAARRHAAGRYQDRCLAGLEEGHARRRLFAMVEGVSESPVSPRLSAIRLLPGLIAALKSTHSAVGACRAFLGRQIAMEPSCERE